MARRPRVIARPLGKKPTFKYRPQWGLVVVCAHEREQQRLYRRLRAMGLQVRVVVV